MEITRTVTGQLGLFVMVVEMVERTDNMKRVEESLTCPPSVRNTHHSAHCDSLCSLSVNLVVHHKEAVQSPASPVHMFDCLEDINPQFAADDT